MKEKEDIYTMTTEEYLELIRSSLMLSALESGGVDNWAGYELAQDEFEGDYKLWCEENPQFFDEE